MAGASATAGVLRLAFASLGPGLLVLGLLRAPADAEGWRLALALTLSPVLLAGATALLAFGAGLSLAGATQATSWGVCAGLVVAAVRVRALAGEPQPRPSGRDLALGLLPTLALTALACAVLLPPGTRLSYHGLVHAGFVAQIASGVVPPENPAMAGEPLRYYWMYHWLLAVLHELGGRSMLLNAPLTNVVSLVVYVAAGHHLLRRFLAPAPAALAALAVGFAMNLLFPLLFLGRAAAGALPEETFHFPFKMLEAGLLGGDPRLVTLFAKFLNSSGFPLGLALWAALVVELLPAEDRQPRPLIVFLLLCGTLLFHSAAAMAAYLGLSLAFFSVSVPALRRATWGGLVRANLPLAGVFVAALVATGPYLLVTLYAPDAMSGPPASQPATLLYNAAGVMLSATPLVVVLALAAWRLRGDPAARYLTVAGGVTLALGLFLNVPDGNQYKLVQLASFPLGVLMFRLLGDAPDRLGRSVFAGVVGLAVLSHGLTAAAYARSEMSRSRLYAGDGAYLAMPGEPAVDDALRWLRDHTPADAVVVGVPLSRGLAPTAAVSGRGDFVLRALFHFHGPDYRQRMRLATALFSPEGSAGPALGRIAELLERPLYVVLLRRWDPENFEALRAKFARAPEALTEVHRVDGGSVYAVRTGGPP